MPPFYHAPPFYYTNGGFSKLLLNVTAVVPLQYRWWFEKEFTRVHTLQLSAGFISIAMRHTL